MKVMAGDAHDSMYTYTQVTHRSQTYTAEGPTLCVRLRVR